MVTQHEAISIDGERIPYVQTGPADRDRRCAGLYERLWRLRAFGEAAITIPRSASCGSSAAAPCVQANIRGGGEFGTRWHDAGRYAGKRLSHDDFAAVAADLVRRGVTRPSRIAAEGGSNGGILITNMLVRYPERFGALFCTIPLIDMRRYTKLLAGASWIAEYGDPDKPEEWDWLQTYSAYHLAKPGQTYPPILIATTRRDDRVHPGHARKMAAKLQAMGYEAYFYEPAAGGHGYGKDNKERAGFDRARLQLPEAEDRLVGRRRVGGGFGATGGRNRRPDERHRSTHPELPIDILEQADSTREPNPFRRPPDDSLTALRGAPPAQIASG